jgi:hypothetical protein
MGRRQPSAGLLQDVFAFWFFPTLSSHLGVFSVKRRVTAAATNTMHRSCCVCLPERFVHARARVLHGQFRRAVDSMWFIGPYQWHTEHVLLAIGCMTHIFVLNWGYGEPQSGSGQWEIRTRRENLIIICRGSHIWKQHERDLVRTETPIRERYVTIMAKNQLENRLCM